MPDTRRTIKVSFQNSGGELDSCVVSTPEAARAAVLRLVEAVPYLEDGDKIIVEETDA